MPQLRIRQTEWGRQLNCLLTPQEALDTELLQIIRMDTDGLLLTPAVDVDQEETLLSYPLTGLVCLSDLQNQCSFSLPEWLLLLRALMARLIALQDLLPPSALQIDPDFIFIHGENGIFADLSHPVILALPIQRQDALQSSTNSFDGIQLEISKPVIRMAQESPLLGPELIDRLILTAFERPEWFHGALSDALDALGEPDPIVKIDEGRSSRHTLSRSTGREGPVPHRSPRTKASAQTKEPAPARERVDVSNTDPGTSSCFNSQRTGSTTMRKRTASASTQRGQSPKAPSTTTDMPFAEGRSVGRAAAGRAIITLFVIQILLLLSIPALTRYKLLQHHLANTLVVGVLIIFALIDGILLLHPASPLSKKRTTHKEAASKQALAKRKEQIAAEKQAGRVDHKKKRGRGAMTAQATRPDAMLTPLELAYLEEGTDGLEAERAFKTIHLNRPLLLIGSDPLHADLCLKTQEIRESHAVIEYRDGKYWLSAIEGHHQAFFSTGAKQDPTGKEKKPDPVMEVWLNGDPVSDDRAEVIEDGDILRFGRFIFSFQLDEAA